MVNSERAKVFMDQSKNDSFDDKADREGVSSHTDNDTVFSPNFDKLINQSQSFPQLPVPKGRRRHCSEGEVVVKEKVRRYRNRSVSDKDLEQVLGAAAWLLALADNNNLEATKKPARQDGSDACSTDESPPLVRGLFGSAVDVSTLGTAVNMKGWGLNSTGQDRLAVPAGRSASCNTSPTKAPSSTRPLNKYAAILASVGCTPPSVAPCPLSLLSGPRSVRRTTDSGMTTTSAVTWAHHTCCTTSTVTTTTHVKPNMTSKMAPSTEKSSPGSTKGIGSKSCSINLKTFSASFNCRTATSSLASSPTTSTANKALSTLTTTSSPPAAVAAKETTANNVGSVRSKPPEKCESKPSKTALKTSSAKSSPSGSRKSKSSPKTLRTSRGDSHGSSTKSKKSSKSHHSKVSSSSSSKSSSSSSVATIDCETVSVNIPDRPMCVMTTSWTPDDDLMSPMSWTSERHITNQNESLGGGDPSGDCFDRKWHEPSGYIVDNSSVNYQGSILHSDSLSSEADEENNRLSASQRLRSSLRETQSKTDSANAINDDGHDTATTTATSGTNNSSVTSERRIKPRPLSLPSNHKLDLKLCYFNPNIDTGLNDNSETSLHQRSSGDLEFDLKKFKRHSSGLSKASADRWHSALHPLIHSQSQILQESELSKVAKVKILSRTSWCECSQEFLMTSLNQRHKCHSESHKEEEMSSSSQSSLAKNENGTSCQCKDGESCSCCHGNSDDPKTGGSDVNEMRIPKAPSDEFLSEAMKYTRDKLNHRCGEDLVTLLEQFYKQIQSVSEELVVLLQERHDLHEQVDMRKIAIEQLVRLQNEAAAANDVNSIQMSVILPNHQGNQR